MSKNEIIKELKSIKDLLVTGINGTDDEYEDTTKDLMDGYYKFMALMSKIEKES